MNNGNIKYCLGIKIKCDWFCKILFVSQKIHIYDILYKFHMETCKPIATPLHGGIHYTKDMMPSTYEEQVTMAWMPYANAIGCLMYFTTHTRLDIAFIIRHLAQIMSNFGLVHWFVSSAFCTMSKQHNICTLNILHFPSHLSLCFFKVGQMQIVHVTLTLDNLFLVMYSLLVVMPFHGKVVSNLLWFYLLLSLNILLLSLPPRKPYGYDNYSGAWGPTCLHYDNQSCIKFTQNAYFHDWLKHIELWFDFLREKIDLQELKLHCTSIGTMWTDILTKSLLKPKHGLWIQDLGLILTPLLSKGVW
jgi:hypothetical protein